MKLGLDDPVVLVYPEQRLKIKAFISGDRKSFHISINDKPFLEYPRRQDFKIDATGKVVKIVNEIETQLLELN